FGNLRGAALKILGVVLAIYVEDPYVEVSATVSAFPSEAWLAATRKARCLSNLKAIAQIRSLCGGFWACERVSERSVTGRYHKGTMLIEAVLQIPGPYVEVSGPASAFPSKT
ncbi:MAG: hypothetical protein ABF639_10240, partial [Lacticaseibacillus paracasei]